MQTRPPLLHSLFLLCALAPALFAADQTWSNLDADWGTGANWGGSIPGLANSTSNSSDLATLPASGSQIHPNLAGNFSIGGLVIDNSLGNYNITQTDGPRTLRILGVTINGEDHTAIRLVDGGTTRIAPNVILASATNASTKVFQLGNGSLHFDGRITLPNAGTRLFDVRDGHLFFNDGVSVLPHATTTTRALTLQGNGNVFFASYGCTNSDAGPIPITLSASYSGVFSLAGAVNVFNTTTAVTLSGGTLELQGPNPLSGAGISWTGNSGTVLRAGTGGTTIHGTVTYNRSAVTDADLGLLGVIGGDQDLTFAGTFRANDNAGNSNRQIVTISNTGLTSFHHLNFGGNNSSLRAIAVDTAGSGVTAEIYGTLSKAASGTGNFSKLGAGTLIQSGTASHTGTTSIEAGTFLVTGEMASGGGAVTVFSGAALGGSGTIHRNITFNAGANLHFDGVHPLTTTGPASVSADSAFTTSSWTTGVQSPTPPTT